MLLGFLLALEAGLLIGKLDDKYESLSTLELSVVHRIEAGREYVERWNYLYKAPNKFRIEYSGGAERVLVSNGRMLWEYVPTKKIVLITNLLKLTPDRRNKLFASIMARVAIKGLRLETEKLRKLRVLSQKGDLAHIAGIKADGYTLSATIDTKKLLLVKSEIRDADGKLITSTESVGEQEAGTGIWFPRLIKIRSRVYTLKDNASLERALREGYTIRDVSVNREIDDGKFEFQIPQGVRVRR